MTGLGRHFSAALVAIAMIAAQVLPAWAGCHSAKHAVAVAVAVNAATDHGAMHAAVSQADTGQIETSDQTQPTKGDLCLGNCGCACGLSGAFVLANAAMIDAPPGITLERLAPAIAAGLGRTPDGLRRPPRTAA